MGAVAFYLGYEDGREQRSINESHSPYVIVAVVLTFMIAVFAWSVRYWRNIDEMAKRAHLDAFFWGGGMIGWAILGAFLTPMLIFPDLEWGVIEQIGGTTTHSFGMGAFTALTVTTLGYGVFWLVWWAKKR
jgi:hypothetical protein